jgi:hypothetical protein
MPTRRDADFWADCSAAESWRCTRCPLSYVLNEMKRIILRTIGIFGSVLFATFFALTFSTPTWLETFARSFIQAEVKKQVDARIDGLKIEDGKGVLAQYAGAIYRQNEQKIDQLKADLKSKVHEQFADALVQIADLKCECRARIAALIAAGDRVHIERLDAMNAKLVDVIQSNYLRIVAELKGDIRIFSGTNCAAFLLLLAATFLRLQALGQLFVPGILLAIAAVTCACLYVFEQNWLLTIIYSDYLGFGYLAYLVAAFALLMDVFLNRARITTRIANSACDLVGATASFIPC